MSRLLGWLFGRLPIGWLQLTHNRARMAAALAGVAFANVLVFVQLGMLGALNGTIGMTYSLVEADILISANDTNTLADGSNVARRHMLQALAVPGVAAAAPLYLAELEWTRPDGSIASMQVYGLQPEAERFAAASIARQLPWLRLQDTALIDTRTRGLEPGALGPLSFETPLLFEANGTRLMAIGGFTIGGGFTTDGNLVVSDQTFLRLFGQRVAGTPSHLMIQAAPGEDHRALARRIGDALGDAPLLARPLAEAIEADLAYQTTQRPIGLIFGMGVVIGALVGIVIVYQILSSDVADHLREYATFKAMGYPHRFFLGVVFEEALVLGALGFLPGVVIATLIYGVMASATGLPIAMGIDRALAVFLGTILACTLSGIIATRRLRAADPADLF